MSERERRPDDALARVRLGDEDRRALDAAERHDDARVGRRRPIADRQGHREEVLGLDRAVRGGAGRPIRLDEQRIDAVGTRPQEHPQPEVAAGHAHLHVRRPVRRVRQRDRAVPEERPVGIVDREQWRRPEAVLVEREPGHRQRVIHPDDLAGKQLTVAVDGEVGREVRRLAARQPRGLEPEALDDEQPGRSDRLDRDGVAARHDEPLLHAEPARDGRREQEQDEPGVGEQGRHLRELVAVAVEVAHPVLAVGLADAEPMAAQRLADGRSVRARHDRPVRQLRIEIAVGLGDPDLDRLAPHPRRPVERADDDRDEEHDERATEPGRREDAEHLEALEEVHDARPERRVIAVVEEGHLGRVVGAARTGGEGE